MKGARKDGAECKCDRDIIKRTELYGSIPLIDAKSELKMVERIPLSPELDGFVARAGDNRSGKGSQASDVISVAFDGSAQFVIAHISSRRCDFGEKSEGNASPIEELSRRPP